MQGTLDEGWAWSTEIGMYLFHPVEPGVDLDEMRVVLEHFYSRFVYVVIVISRHPKDGVIIPISTLNQIVIFYQQGRDAD
jgi:hypothetical protein